jgi:DnaJ-class molecular chaperone
VTKNASEADIKKAFRQLAKKHHPDKHAGDAAAQKKFQEISAAYDILGDKDKRAQFDAGAIGADGNARGFDPRQGFNPGGFRQGSPFGGAGSREFHFSFDDANAGGGPNGDVLLQVAVAPHPFIVRDGNDLRMDLPVTLKEAVAGGKVPVPTLAGTLSLTVPAGSNTGSTLRLKGKGVPAHGKEEAGDLYVRLVISLPDAPDAALKAFVDGWNPSYDPRARLK